ncbi:hybrid sensor histidine kinase/response regulator [Brumimicrobium aurantiacum]|uniref:histidine kinase n=1 Tax=Brumimicrobium aurantiacum TaxID=1737063 RepID=A0A3E1EVX2_9FLAO|nr:ATP-binding protein [Brumimicrobium aurantiacum]RFC53706.1 response regulator [Brumimicrobium aurantiacum]
MFGLKGKTLLYFVITTVLLSAIGTYFIVSFHGLIEKVEERFEPQKQTSLLKSLTVDVNNLNNQYLNDSLQLTSQYIDSIIKRVEVNIENIKLESRKINFEESNNLDTIPKMLYALKERNFKLKELRENGENNFIYSLENVIQDEIKDKLLTEKDSIVVTHQITSYIKENKIITKKIERTPEVDERNFFQKLFKPKELDSTTSAEEIIQKGPVEIDTTTQKLIDTLNQGDSLKSPVDLVSLFDEIQNRRLRYVNNVQSVEKDIYELNYRINKKIENIINAFILQQYVTYERYLAELNEDTQKQSNILFFAIIGFTLFSIILVYRFFKDINRGLDYQNTLKKKEEEAIRATEEKQRFLNMMSHELRTPLTSIVGYADLLENQDENSRAIKSSANYLFQMTNEILDIAKIDLGVIEVNETPIDLTNLLQEVKDNFIPQLKSKGLNFEFDIPQRSFFIQTDGQRIQQILYNLLHNAIKFTNEGEVKLKLEIKEFDHHIHIVFRVIDTGIGMDEEEQSHVFKDFHQAGTHKSKLKGTGLGLGIVEKLVHILNGDIQLNSEKNKGTSFVLAFDFKKLGSDEIESLKESKEEDVSFNAHFEGKNILIVDDDLLITALFEKILRPTKANLTVFNNPEIALEKALCTDYDLIIIDYKMPEMTGFEFLKQLKSNKTKLPIVLVATANTMLKDEERSKLNSFDAIIFKPLRRIPFLQLIAKHFELDQDGNSEFQVSPSKTDSFDDAEETQLNFDVIKNFVGDEKDELISILEVIVEENEQSLTEFKMAIDSSDFESITFVIHQLSSRFGQTDQSLIVDTRALEHQLKNDASKVNMREVEELYEFWKKAQEQIRKEMSLLKG